MVLGNPPIDKILKELKRALNANPNKPAGFFVETVKGIKTNAMFIKFLKRLAKEKNHGESKTRVAIGEDGVAVRKSLEPDKFISIEQIMENNNLTRTAVKRAFEKLETLKHEPTLKRLENPQQLDVNYPKMEISQNDKEIIRQHLLRISEIVEDIVDKINANEKVRFSEYGFDPIRLKTENKRILSQEIASRCNTQLRNTPHYISMGNGPTGILSVHRRR